MPCIEYKGKKYTYEEFGAMLRDGAFAKMAKSGELNVENLGAEVPSSLLEAARKQIGPQTSSNFANLTTDEDGNYVFFHRGAKGFDEIRPGTGQSGITPSNEAAAIGRVGGVAMYYTKPTDSETMVSGQAQYAVTIAPDEVYDFNEDPENYIVEARKRFEQENPGKAFDANNQLAYITKIAGENGYKMVVAEWTNGRTRAQTTEALKPTDTQLFEGDVVTKKFDKQYTTNEQKGWSPVVPETRQNKLDALYNKIYKERNKQNRYDDLYRLEEEATKKTQDEITELINNSDISQELKDEYNQILGEEEQTRRSERKAAQETTALDDIFDNTEIQSEVDNALKAMSEIMPELKIVVHDTYDSYLEALGESEEAESGGFFDGDSTIHINKRAASDTTVAHEVFHAVLKKMLGSERAIQKKTLSMVRNLSGQIKSDPRLKATLDEFVSRYTENPETMNEEAISELFGMLSAGYAELKPVERSAIRKFIDAIAKLLGLGDFLRVKENEYVDLLNTLSQRIRTGEAITAEDVVGLRSKDYQSGVKVENSIKKFQNNYLDPVSKVEFVYDKNSDDFKLLEENGYITKDRSIIDFNGSYMFLHSPDGAFSGFIYKNGELLVEGKGGVFYPIKFHKEGYFWASTDKAAKKMAEDLNKVYKQNNGKILMALTTAPSEKLLSSTTAANAVMEIFIKKSSDRGFSINKDQVKNSLINAASLVRVVEGKKIGLGLKIRKGDSIESIRQAISDKLNPEKSTFKDRKLFSESLISNIADIVKNNEKATEQFNRFFIEGIKDASFKGTKAKGKNYYKISNANLKAAISNMLVEPMLKGVNESGLVYAVIELNGEVESEKSDKHESYPMTIKSKVGSEVKLHILKDRVKWSDVFEDPETNDIITDDRKLELFPTSGVSTKGLKLNTKKISPVKKQISAYHGSPYDFDRFTTSAIGTGEGAQAFGWGLYFTDLESIAKDYANKLSDFRISIDNKSIYPLTSNELENLPRHLDFMKESYVGLSKEDIKRKIKDESIYEPTKKKLLEELDRVKSINIESDRNLYKVSLHKGKTPDQYTWLEWDKPVSNDVRNRVQKGLEKAGIEYKSPSYNQTYWENGEKKTRIVQEKNWVQEVKTGEELYEALAIQFNGSLTEIQKKASLFLLENGIDGVKYPAESISRGATSDTARGFNYVVFDENAVTIEERVKFQKPSISKKIEAALNSGATEQEIIDKMTQVGYTEAEAKAYIEQYNNMRSDEYARVKANIDTITKKVADRAGKNANPKEVRQRQYDDAMNYLQSSLWYENASDTEREASVRELRSDLGFKERTAPVASKVTEGKRDTITIDSLQALNQSIRDQDRGAKAALKDLAEKREALRVALNTLVNKAKITARQATTILNKFSKVNLNDDQAVKDLIDYVEQTYKDAEITNQVRQAAQTAKDERRGAKTALKDLAEKREALRVALKSLVTSGKITNRQASVMLNKAMSVNLNNDNAVDKLIKYIEKVYNNAEIAEKMSKANAMRRVAKKNIRSKIGSAKVAFPILDKLFSIDSREIPLEVLDTYVGIVNQFGKRVGILSTDKMADVIQKAQDVISAINEEVSKVNDLAMIFEMYPDKVLDANGDVLFDKTVKKMKDDGYIDDATAKEMDEYRSDIYKKERATKEEDAQERKDLIKEIVAAKLVTSSRLSDANERKAAREIIQMARNKKILKALSTQSLRNLAAIMKNIDAGFFPNYGVKLMQAMQIEQQLPDVKNTFENVSLRVISNAYNKLKSLVFRGQTSIELTLESNLATELDFMLGDNKNRHIYNAVIKPLAKAYATFDSEVTSIREKMSEAVEMLERQFSGNTNKVAASKFKIMAYMLQKEFESNPGQKGVAPAIDFINQTIKAIKGRDTIYTERDVEILEDIKENYMTDGQIDMNKIMDSLSAREKKALGILESINASMHDKAIFTSGVIRGNRTNMYNNYVPHSVISRRMDNDEKMASVVNAYNNVQAVGTKAGSLQERTSGAKPIMFDPFLASMNSATDVLLDFHMTIPMQTTSKLLQRAKDELLNDDASDKSIDAVNAVQAIRDRVARFVFTNNKYHDDSILATVGRSYLNTMYRNTLGSVPRFINELQSNSWYVLTNPANWASGVKYVYKDSDAIGGVQGREIMSLLGSTVVGKLYGKGATGKFADVGLLGSDDVAQGSSSKGSLEVTKDVIARYSVKPLAKFTDYVGDTLVSTPDKLMSIPIWYGSFANEFKRRTGEDIEFSKITDERYRNKYKAALDAATDYADNEVVQAASTVNPFQKAAKLNVDKSKPAYRRFIATVNNYLTNFMITEFNTARAAAYSLVTEGRIPKPKAAAMLTGVYLRVVTYTLMSNIITGGFYSLLGFDKDDEEEEELTWDDVVRAAAGGFISMLVSRNFGNIFKIAENYGIEKLNEEYGDMLRQGEEYDPYKHSLVFNKIKEKEIAKDPLKTLSVNFAGPYGETVKGVWKINDLIEYENRLSGKNKFSEMKKRMSLSGRRKAERMEDMKDDVIFRVGAGSGLIPFAKDIKPIMSGRYKKKGED